MWSHVTVKPRYNDPRYNDIPDITMNIILCPGKSYSEMYGSEPRYNDITFLLPWHIVISGFHCSVSAISCCVCPVVLLLLPSPPFQYDMHSWVPCMEAYGLVVGITSHGLASFQWKPLDIPGTQHSFSKAVVNQGLILFSF